MGQGYEAIYSMRLVGKQETAVTLGCLSKAWYANKDGVYLAKGNMRLDKGGYGWEPYSEAIASIVASVLDVPHIPYTLAPAASFPAVKTYGIPVVSICKMEPIPAGCQKISAITYMEAYHRREINTNFWTMFNALPIDKTSTLDMLVIDAIVGNIDRHLNNWEYLLKPNGEVSLVPSFDFGESLLAQQAHGLRCLSENAIGPDKSKPFKDTHTRQMHLIKHAYPEYHFTRDIQSCWRMVERGIAPILKSMPDVDRASKVYTYLHNRFFFYLKLMG